MFYTCISNDHGGIARKRKHYFRHHAEEDKKELIDKYGFDEQAVFIVEE